MAAVLDPYRDQHIGTALKMHQRVWALEQGIDTIVWTFDPLVRRNARVNLLKLGVDVDGFEVDFYGSMDDGINSGDPTDRLFAWWHLDSPRVFSASMGQLVPVDPIDLVVSGRDAIEIELPEDIVALRATDPVAAAPVAHRRARGVPRRVRRRLPRHRGQPDRQLRPGEAAMTIDRFRLHRLRHPAGPSVPHELRHRDRARRHPRRGHLDGRRERLGRVRDDVLAGLQLRVRRRGDRRHDPPPRAGAGRGGRPR